MAGLLDSRRGLVLHQARITPAFVALLPHPCPTGLLMYFALPPQERESLRQQNRQLEDKCREFQDALQASRLWGLLHLRFNNEVAIEGDAVLAAAACSCGASCWAAVCAQHVPKRAQLTRPTLLRLLCCSASCAER